MTEIERKFLVAEVPADLGPGATIRQGYLAVDGPTEVRIRSIDDRCALTVKGGHGIERAEVELDLERTRFDELWNLTQDRRIDKVRHRIALDTDVAGRADVAEVDVYAGALGGLVVVEVEFASRGDAAAFAVPGWFGRELTDEPGWSNAALAASGRPA